MKGRQGRSNIHTTEVPEKEQNTETKKCLKSVYMKMFPK